MNRTIEDLLRECAPQVLGAVVRRYGHFDTAEDAVQEALLAAAQQWPAEGIPRTPRAWLITVASRRLADQLRSDQARRRREDRMAVQIVPETAAAADQSNQDFDDTLVLLFLCCHPTLSPASQIGLTLRAVGGLTTTQIARAFLVPESTMAQRISRAKQSVRQSGATFTMPPPPERLARLGVVLRVLYLIFNEGYTASSGPDLMRAELSGEAVRLTRMLHRILPTDGEVSGLLALMLLTDARRAARADDGRLIPLDQQDRSRWDRDLIDEGTVLIDKAMSAGSPGPYQIQAAIAALHDDAAEASRTDWPQILVLYRVLEELDDSPMVILNRAVAQAMVEGPEAGLATLDELDADSRLRRNHRLAAVRAHLLELAGSRDSAIENYRAAAKLTTSIPERDYLVGRANRLTTAD